MEKLTANTGEHSTASSSISGAGSRQAYCAFDTNINTYWSTGIISSTASATVTYLDDVSFDCSFIFLLIVYPGYNANYHSLRDHVGVVEYTVDGINWITVSELTYTTQDMIIPHFFSIKDNKIRGVRYTAKTPNMASRDGYEVHCYSLLAF